MRGVVVLSIRPLYAGGAPMQEVPLVRFLPIRCEGSIAMQEA